MSTELRNRSNLGEYMNRIGSILSALSLAILFFVGSAHAQSRGQRIIANVPFQFTVGNISLPAGQYEFRLTGGGENVLQVRDGAGHSQFTLPSSPMQANRLHEESALKFTTVDGRHVLVQIWSELSDTGEEFSF
jgi:hypothetical protein